MKHESNDTPPFAPDDPISRSLFVRPNLIERLCASACSSAFRPPHRSS